MNRDDNLCMMRVKNEARWIRRSLERTWQVCRTAVIFDDHSTDETLTAALQSLNIYPSTAGTDTSGAVVYDNHDCQLHWLSSPFAESVNEVRDKNYLWEYASGLKFRHVLCLDGDEWLSQRALRHFPTAIAKLEHGGADVIVMPFYYLWDSETHRRVDGVYADIRHARLFTIDRAPKFRDCQFAATGRAGFHCGSIPSRLSVRHFDMPEMTVIHMGYIDDALRRRKLAFYNTLDPNNSGEGFYKHVVGESNHLAPGPVRVMEFVDK